MNGRLGLAGISIIFALCACGGGSGSGSSTTPPAANTTGTPGNNTGTNPPPDNSAGGTRPDNVAGFVYVANAGSDNISAYSIDAATGRLQAIAGTPFPTGRSPYDLAIHSSGKFAYAANLNSDSVSAYTVDAQTGALSAIGPATVAGTGPNHVTIDPTGKFAYVTNTGNNVDIGSISAYTIDHATGALTSVPGSPFSPGFLPLTMTVHPSGKFAYATFLTESEDRIDRIVSYSIDTTTGALATTGTSNTGWHPSIFVLDPNGRYAFVGNRLASSISVFSIDPGTGVLTQVAGSPFSLAHNPETITIDAAGKFLYVMRLDTNGNRFVTILAVAPGSGTLTEIAGSPYSVASDSASLTIHPSGKFAYIGNGSEFSGGLSVVDIDPTTGALSNTRTITTPAGGFGVKIDPTGRAAYAVNSPPSHPGSILAFLLDPTTGNPTLNGSVPTATNPVGLEIIW